MKEIYKIIYGSKAYGTDDEDSDTDIRGILLPTIDESLGLKNLYDYAEVSDKDGIDTVMYSIQKFCWLALKSNPGVLEWLFVPIDCIEHMTKEGSHLRHNKNLFVTKEVYPRFKGYSQSEYKKLTTMTHSKGKKRKDQIRKYGYSLKNGMNLIRLVEQGIELLRTGNITIPRPNTDELLKIKRGEVGLSYIEQKYASLEKELDLALEESTLPDKPNFDEVNSLMISIIKNKTYLVLEEKAWKYDELCK